ncbi:MAG: HD domain-containing protein [Bacteroidales bacterium]
MKHPLIHAYHSILSPDFPDFIAPYLELPVLKRLDGVGLLCGTDWTSLYNNRFFYSRLDHSIGVALIIWNFTKDKKQTLAGLFHDISTPVFSHVMDFRNNDALTQESTEKDTAEMIMADRELCGLLRKEGISVADVVDYHVYPVADNDLPALSADRLEYMYMTGLIMNDLWTMDEIRETYANIHVMENEHGIPELGFSDPGIAELYCIRCCQTGLLMVKNENKLTLSLLAHLAGMAVSKGFLTERDFYSRSENEIIALFGTIEDVDFKTHFRTFTGMTHILRSEEALEGCFNVNTAVKRRYINPLCNGRRIGLLSEKAACAIAGIMDFTDAPYGAVRLIY